MGEHDGRNPITLKALAWLARPWSVIVLSKPVHLNNGRTWPSQKAAKQHFKNMLARYHDGDVVKDASDHADLAALLERYDRLTAEVPTKIGVGIDKFFRRRNVNVDFATSGFHVRRTDGTETDFSYITAVEGRSKSQSAGFNDACRHAIAADTLAFKQRYFDDNSNDERLAPCECSGELIGFDEAHVDHASPTFDQLVHKFREARGWTDNIPAEVLTAASDAQTKTTFADDNVSKAFREFHASEAELRVISQSENLAKGAR